MNLLSLERNGKGSHRCFSQYIYFIILQSVFHSTIGLPYDQSQNIPRDSPFVGVHLSDVQSQSGAITKPELFLSSRALTYSSIESEGDNLPNESKTKSELVVVDSNIPVSKSELSNPFIFTSANALHSVNIRHKDTYEDDHYVELSPLVNAHNHRSPNEKLSLSNSLWGQYNYVDMQGTSKWGYKTNDQHQEHEAFRNGNMKGTFGWTDPSGHSVAIQYIADENGYRVISSSGIYLKDDDDVRLQREKHLEEHESIRRTYDSIKFENTHKTDGSEEELQLLNGAHFPSLGKKVDISLASLSSINNPNNRFLTGLDDNKNINSPTFGGVPLPSIDQEQDKKLPFEYSTSEGISLPINNFKKESSASDSLLYKSDTGHAQKENQPISLFESGIGTPLERQPTDFGHGLPLPVSFENLHGISLPTIKSDGKHGMMDTSPSLDHVKDRTAHFVKSSSDGISLPIHDRIEVTGASGSQLHEHDPASQVIDTKPILVPDSEINIPLERQQAEFGHGLLLPTSPEKEHGIPLPTFTSSGNGNLGEVFTNDRELHKHEPASPANEKQPISLSDSDTGTPLERQPTDFAHDLPLPVSPEVTHGIPLPTINIDGNRGELSRAGDSELHKHDSAFPFIEKQPISFSDSGIGTHLDRQPTDFAHGLTLPMSPEKEHGISLPTINMDSNRGELSRVSYSDLNKPDRVSQTIVKQPILFSESGIGTPLERQPIDFPQGLFLPVSPEKAHGVPLPPIDSDDNSENVSRSSGSQLHEHDLASQVIETKPILDSDSRINIPLDRQPADFAHGLPLPISPEKERGISLPTFKKSGNDNLGALSRTSDKFRKNDPTSPVIEKQPISFSDSEIGTPLEISKSTDFAHGLPLPVSPEKAHGISLPTINMDVNRGDVSRASGSELHKPKPVSPVIEKLPISYSDSDIGTPLERKPFNSDHGLPLPASPEKGQKLSLPTLRRVSNRGEVTRASDSQLHEHDLSSPVNIKQPIPFSGIPLERHPTDVGQELPLPVSPEKTLGISLPTFIRDGDPKEVSRASGSKVHGHDRASPIVEKQPMSFSDSGIGIPLERLPNEFVHGLPSPVLSEITHGISLSDATIKGGGGGNRGLIEASPTLDQVEGGNSVFVKQSSGGSLLPIVGRGETLSANNNLPHKHNAESPVIEKKQSVAFSNSGIDSVFESKPTDFGASLILPISSERAHGISLPNINSNGNRRVFDTSSSMGQALGETTTPVEKPSVGIPLSFQSREEVPRAGDTLLEKHDAQNLAGEHRSGIGIHLESHQTDFRHGLPLGVSLVEAHGTFLPNINTEGIRVDSGSASPVINHAEGSISPLEKTRSAGISLPIQDKGESSTLNNGMLRKSQAGSLDIRPPGLLLPDAHDITENDLILMTNIHENSRSNNIKFDPMDGRKRESGIPLSGIFSASQSPHLGVTNSQNSAIFKDRSHDFKDMVTDSQPLTKKSSVRQDMDNSKGNILHDKFSELVLLAMSDVREPKNVLEKPKSTIVSKQRTENISVKPHGIPLFQSTGSDFQSEQHEQSSGNLFFLPDKAEIPSIKERILGVDHGQQLLASESMQTEKVSPALNAQGIEKFNSLLNLSNSAQFSRDLSDTNLNPVLNKDRHPTLHLSQYTDEIKNTEANLETASDVNAPKNADQERFIVVVDSDILQK